LRQEDRGRFIPYIDYIEKELDFLGKYESEVDWKVYQRDRSRRLEVERWVECLINATLDVSKMFLASEGEVVPETSREVLYRIAAFIFEKERDAETFSELARIRNTLAHHYLDIRWQDIKRFFKIATELYPPFLQYLKHTIGI